MMGNGKVLAQVKDLVAEVGIGILTTIDEKGSPVSRWVTPVFVPRLSGALYAVTSADFRKARHIAANPKVSWIFQSRSLDRIATVTGTASVVKDPSLSAEVLETIGPKLQVFWKYSGDPKKLVVLETVVESVSMFRPMGDGFAEEATDGR